VELRFKLGSISTEGCIGLVTALLAALSGLMLALRKWWPGHVAKRRERAELDVLEAQARRAMLEAHREAVAAVKRRLSSDEPDEPERLGPRRIERRK
jgi:hypothetical protein